MRLLVSTYCSTADATGGKLFSSRGRHVLQRKTWDLPNSGLRGETCSHCGANSTSSASSFLLLLLLQVFTCSTQ